MEGLVTGVTSHPFGDFFAGKHILLTGHTGFKGGWLALWLKRLGACVHGFALDPPTEPSFFNEAGVGNVLSSDSRGNLADLPNVSSVFERAQPEIVFHLAAQPLVRASYRDPLGTFTSNVTGTAHVLEAARASKTVQALVLVTTDKVYASSNTTAPYLETDPLGGHDPYSASKAAAEIVAASYRSSFFPGKTGHAAHVATVRAGNVIGGGDWAVERLVPDCLRAFARNETVRLRFPNAVRPWQHVLEPLAGYLELAKKLSGPDGRRFARSWNLGPDTTRDVTVGEVAGIAARCWGSNARLEDASSETDPPEAASLRLDSTLARTQLGWKPRWSLEKALSETVAWHRAWIDRADMEHFSTAQIRAYENEGAC